MRILLIQTAFIGDVILTTPLIAAIKAYLPHSELSIVVKKEVKPVLDANPDIKEIFTVNKSPPRTGEKRRSRYEELRELAEEIKKRKFDVLLSVHKSHRTAALAVMSEIPLRIGFADSGFVKTAYHYRIESFKALPEIHRLLYFLYMALPVIHHSQFRIDLPAARNLRKSSLIRVPWKEPDEFLSLKFFPDQLHLYETDESREEAEALIKEKKLNNPVLIGGSSVWPTKRWVPEGFAELILRLLQNSRETIALIGSPSDSEISSRIISIAQEKASGDPALTDQLKSRVLNLCGATSLPGLYSLMLRSRMLISNDSSPVHFACAARIPVVALFGPTVTSHGYAPVTPESRVAEVKGLYCRPCGSHGGKKCPEGHFLCMKLITPAMVMKKANEITGL